MRDARASGEVANSESIGALRAALGRVFEKVTLLRKPDGELVLAQQVRAFEEIEAWVPLDDGRQRSSRSRKPCPCLANN